MRVCRKCPNVIPTTVLVDGFVRVLSSRKYCLECSPFGSRNTKKLEIPEPITRICTKCKVPQHPSNFYGSGDAKHYECKICFNARSSEKVRRLKQWAVEYKGGKCEICGYNRCQAAMDFHHTDPSAKEFSISIWMVHNNLSDESRTKCALELDKCQLLCSNCHREIHFKHQMEVRG